MPNGDAALADSVRALKLWCLALSAALLCVLALAVIGVVRASGLASDAHHAANAANAAAVSNEQDLRAQVQTRKADALQLCTAINGLEVQLEDFVNTKHLPGKDGHTLSVHLKRLPCAQQQSTIQGSAP